MQIDLYRMNGNQLLELVASTEIEGTVHDVLVQLEPGADLEMITVHAEEGRRSFLSSTSGWEEVSQVHGQDLDHDPEIVPEQVTLEEQVALDEQELDQDQDDGHSR